MNWIKENKFLAALGGGTLLGIIILFLVGSLGAGKYTEQKEKFDAAAGDVKGFESSTLYPKTDNKNQKEKALTDYRQSVESLQSAFEPFRPEEIKNISPQEFTDHLLQANTDIRKAFEDAGTIVPEPFFVGFERYRTSLADGKTTGILDYQLNSIKSVLLELAKAKPTELRNVHRPLQPEDEGQAFVAPETMVARQFPLEITFTGTEKAARQFVSSIVKAENQFLVIRSLRVTNAKKDPPKSSDAQFEKPAEAKEAGAEEAFAGGFVLPGEEPATAADPVTPAEAPKVADGTRILAQVLGTEQLNVFLRIDLLQFLPAKKLP